MAETETPGAGDDTRDAQFPTPQSHDHHERIDVLGSLARDRDAALGRDPAGGVPAGAAQSVRPARPEDAQEIGRLQARTLTVTLAAGLETEPAALPPELRAVLDPASFAAGWRDSLEHPPSGRHHTLVALDGNDVVGFAAIVPADQEVLATPAGPVDARDAAEAAALPAQDPTPTGPEGTGAAAAAREVLAERTEAGAVLGAPQPTAAELDAARVDQERRDARPRVVAEIVALEVPEEHGRRGHGSRLVAACVDLARQEGVTHVQTWAVQGEESRTRFLDACGFAPAGLRRASDVGGRRMIELAWFAEI